MTPEAKARLNIDALLQQPGWHARATAQANIHASLGLPKTDGCKTQAAKVNLFQEKIRQFILALPQQAEQARVVAEVDYHPSTICEVGAEVNTNLQRAQALRQATLASASSLLSVET